MSQFQEKFKFSICTIGVPIWQNKSSSVGDIVTITEELKVSYYMLYSQTISVMWQITKVKSFYEMA